MQHVRCQHVLDDGGGDGGGDVLGLRRRSAIAVDEWGSDGLHRQCWFHGQQRGGRGDCRHGLRRECERCRDEGVVENADLVDAGRIKIYCPESNVSRTFSITPGVKGALGALTLAVVVLGKKRR